MLQIRGAGGVEYHVAPTLASESLGFQAPLSSLPSCLGLCTPIPGRDLP